MPDPGLSFIGPVGGNRSQCQLVGATDFTRQFLTSGRALVACRAGFSGGFTLIEERGAEQVARTRNFTLYSVPAAPGSEEAAVVAETIAAAQAEQAAANAADGTGPAPVFTP